MAAYPEAPPFTYDGSQKPPPMTQHYAAYLLHQPSSQGSSYYQRSQTPQASPGLTSSALSYHDSVVSYPKSPMASSAPSTHSVASYNVKYDARKESMVASEFEKHISHEEPAYPRSVMSRDPEKRVVSPGSPRRSAVRHSYNDIERPLHHQDDDDEPVAMDLQSKAFSILLYLSLFNPLISFAILFWTLLALLLSVFLLPVRAFINSSSTPSLTNLILPSLRLQLRFVYSTHVSPDAPSRPAVVLLINLLSPALSFVFCACSWVIALFWFFSAVLGDPAGKDGHNDGVAAVLWIRGKWEGWLRKGLVQ